MSFSTLRPLSLERLVHDDDVAWRECGHEAFSHPFLERGGVDRPVQGLLRDEAAKAKSGDERDRLVVAVRNGGTQSSTTSAASAFARQTCGRPGLVDEHQLRRIEIGLSGKPLPALF
jgi:hypothetical protein